MIYVNTSDAPIYVTTNDDGTIVVTTESESPSQTAIQFQDEGLNLGTRGTVDVINFIGSGVSAVRTGDSVAITVTSGGGSGDVVGPASATGDNIVLFDGATGELIKDSGKAHSTDGTLASNSDAKVPTEKAVKTYVDANASLTNVMAVLPFLTSPSAANAITNQPVAETYYLSSNRHVKKFDATKYTAARLVANITVASSSVNTPRLHAKWIAAFTSGTTVVGDFTTLGTGTLPEAVDLSAVAVYATDWITLPAGAKADVFWCIAEDGGDANADPSLGMLEIQFKV